jgi:hypothetical protein
MFKFFVDTSGAVFNLGTHTEQSNIIQMRTKALLLAAAAVAAVASSQAQVYSVNAVGYVNVTIKPGFNLISNPLTAADNTINTLFKNVQGGAPEGMKVFAYRNGGFVSSQYEPLDEAFLPLQNSSLSILPGEGVFVFSPAPTDKTLTFVGEVPQGNLSNPIPTGFSIRASQVPQAVKPDSIGLKAPVAGEGDKYFRYNTTKKGYDSYQYEPLDDAWLGGNAGDPPGLPVLNVGEAFFYFRVAAPTTWTRTFSVNNPT